MDGTGVWVALLALVVGAVLGCVGALVARARADRVLRAELSTAQAALAQARAELGAERRLAGERAAAHAQDRERLSDHFRAVAAEALAANNEGFLGLAEQRLAAASATHDAVLAGREHAVRSLVEPIATVLDEVRAQVSAADGAREAGRAALDAQVRAMQESSEHLRAETGRLVTALRSSHVRGRWGEVQLRRVVETAGMLEHVDFVEQASLRTTEGVQRPDLVVRLGGGKQVVVDAKVALLGYLDAAAATDDAVRSERMAAHARHVRKHIDDLAAKRYWEQFTPTPEFVVMFLPAEAFLQAAVEVDPGLYEYAMQRNVVLATPMTLVALLRTVGHTWRQEALAANAQAVLTLGRELHGRLSTLGGHVGRLGRQLDGAVRAYNESVSCLESRVLVSARRMAELGVTDEAIESPAQLDRAARHLQTAEPTAPGDGRLLDLVAEPGERERRVASS